MERTKRVIIVKEKDNWRNVKAYSSLKRVLDNANVGVSESKLYKDMSRRQCCVTPTHVIERINVI